MGIDVFEIGFDKNHAHINILERGLRSVAEITKKSRSYNF